MAGQQADTLNYNIKSRLGHVAEGEEEQITYATR